MLEHVKYLSALPFVTCAATFVIALILGMHPPLVGLNKLQDLAILKFPQTQSHCPCL